MVCEKLIDIDFKKEVRIIQLIFAHGYRAAA